MTAPTRHKVLWVEDDSFLNDIIAQKLAQQDWNILNASEGETALHLAQTEHPAVIVLDILLPGMDGIEVLRRLKSDESTKDIPVILFTNLDDAEKMEQSKALGVAGFFVKAKTDLETIITAVQAAMPR